MVTQTDIKSPSSEMSTDPRFQARLRRLVIVSAVMLGAIVALALSANARSMAISLLAAGWLLMPTLLFASIGRPKLRYLLTLPATLVAAGLLIVAAGGAGDSMFIAGWWTITAGVLFGGGLGAWFWYRWMPIPKALDDPFSVGRMALITFHVTLILVGIGLVIAA